MQVARLLEPRDERNLSAKLRQLVRAVQLERRFSKPEILGLYLTLKFKSGMPMPNAMVCHITEGELLVHQDGRTITAPTFYVWTCNKGTDEWVENKGTVRSVMRITDLKA